jgi:ElaB/YqjD/DUF883 family membrane-anchored ribosome-binding protein
MPTTQDRIDRASRNAHDTLEAGRKVAKRAAHELDEASDEVTSTVSRTLSRAEEIARNGMDWMRDGRDRVRTEVTRAGDRTVEYIRHEPVRSVLAAAATGALVYALVQAVRGRRDR